MKIAAPDVAATVIVSADLADALEQSAEAMRAFQRLLGASIQRQVDAEMKALEERLLKGSGDGTPNGFLK
jgi:hypothetical protein